MDGRDRSRRVDAPGEADLEETVNFMVQDLFSVWGLRSVELTDRPLLDSYFASLSEPLSDYTFSQLYTWRNSLRILWRELEGHLCVFANGSGDLTLLVPPIGDTNGDRALSAACELMDQYNVAHGVPDRTRVEYASDELLSRFDRHRLQIESMGFDYVYDVNRMIDLAGGDLASKRQAKNRFQRMYEHRVEPYSASVHLEDCRRLLNSWQAQQDANHAQQPDAIADRVKRSKEARAADLSIETAEALGYRGMVVYVRGGPEEGALRQAGEWSLRGFTFGEPLGASQSSITIEKTDLGTKGLAQFIFSEFCRTCWADRPLVNVGDDWGLETLAWTKMSYRPVKLLQKYVLRRQSAMMVTVKPQVMPAPPATSLVEGMTPLAVNVRLADKKDLTAAVEIERACFSPTLSLKKRQLQYLQQRRTAIFLVAEQGDQIVGEGIALVRQHKSGKSGRIYSLAVGSAARGQKIGQRLLSSMCDALTARGVRRIYLEVEQGNATALHLYTSSGFRSIGTLPDYYGTGRDGIQMMLEMRTPQLAAVA